VSGWGGGGNSQKRVKIKRKRLTPKREKTKGYVEGGMYGVLKMDRNSRDRSGGIGQIPIKENSAKLNPNYREKSVLSGGEYKISGGTKILRWGGGTSNQQLREL